MEPLREPGAYARPAGAALAAAVLSGVVAGLAVRWLLGDAPGSTGSAALGATPTRAGAVASAFAFLVCAAAWLGLIRILHPLIARIHEERTRLALALDAGEIGVYDCDLRTGEGTCSDRCRHLLGLDPGAPLPSMVDHLRCVHPDDVRTVQSALHQAAQAASPYDVEYRVALPDGSIRWVRSKGRAFRRGSAGSHRLVGILQDVTARKGAESVRRRHARPTEMTDGFDSPAAAGTGRDRAYPGIDSALNRLACLMPDAGAGLRASEITPGLANVPHGSPARCAAGQDEVVEAREVIEDALQSLDAAIRESGARIRIASDLPSLRGDRAWISRAIYHLVANALRFARDGEPPDVEVAAYGPAGIAVRDRGPGVAPECSERIFRPFQHGVPGTGLAIARGVAERHGGHAWVEPRKGGGSVFVITFGCSSRAEATPGKCPRPAAVARTARAAEN